MAQPDYVPIVSSDRVRPSSRLPAPAPWEQDRPAEVRSLRAPARARFGWTGPDLGFGLKLAHRVATRAVLAEGEHLEDVVAGCFACGTKRASVFHRAPVVHDMEWAFGLWGFFSEAPAGLAAYRRATFAGASHDYVRQRAVADLVPDDLVRLQPEQAVARVAEWEKWLKPTTKA